LQQPPAAYADVPQQRLATSRLLGAAIRVLRPKQWLKNGLVFFGLVYALYLGDLQRDLFAGLAFVAFCCVSSAGYIFNDLRDLELDRLHPTKRYRPIASGELPSKMAAFIALVLLLGGILVGAMVGPALLAVLAAYVFLTVSYSAWLKHVVLLDVFCVSAGFVLRIIAGAVAVDVPISPWLYVCTILGSLLIALGKRRSEMLEMEDQAEAHRPTLEHYSVEFLDRLIVIAATSSLMAYSLYTFSAENVPKNHLMMVTIPVVLYGVFRYLFLLEAGTLGGRPEELLLSDRSLLAAVLLFLVLSAGILYLGSRAIA